MKWDYLEPTPSWVRAHPGFTMDCGGLEAPAATPASVPGLGPTRQRRLQRLGSASGPGSGPGEEPSPVAEDGSELYPLLSSPTMLHPFAGDYYDPIPWNEAAVIVPNDCWRAEIRSKTPSVCVPSDPVGQPMTNQPVVTGYNWGWGHTWGPAGGAQSNEPPPPGIQIRCGTKPVGQCVLEVAIFNMVRPTDVDPGSVRCECPGAVVPATKKTQVTAAPSPSPTPAPPPAPDVAPNSGSDSSPPALDSGAGPCAGSPATVGVAAALMVAAALQLW